VHKWLFQYSSRGISIAVALQSTCASSTSDVGEPRCGHPRHGRYIHHRHARNNNSMSNFDCNKAGVSNRFNENSTIKMSHLILNCVSAHTLCDYELPITCYSVTNSNAPATPSEAKSSTGS
jgi:hypothetical protein